MIIKDQIIEPFEIHGEELQWILKEKKIVGEFDNRGEPTKNAGEEYLKDVGYYQHPEHLFKQLIRRLLARQIDVLTISEFLAVYKNKQSEVVSVFNKAFN